MSRSVKQDYENLQNPGNTRKLEPKCSWVTELVNNSAKEWCGEKVVYGDHFCAAHRATVTLAKLPAWARSWIGF